MLYLRGPKQKTMIKLKITGKALRAIGYPEGVVMSVAMNVMQKKLACRYTRLDRRQTKLD
jgi:hypothetical protein